MITTDRQLQALKPKGTVYWESVKSPHGGGLAIRVQPTGSKAWYYRYRFNGKQDTYSLGRYPSVGLQEARESHGEAVALHAQGINPKHAQRDEKARNESAWTMAELFERWLQSYAKTPTVRTRRTPSPLVVEQARWRWGHYLKGRVGSLLVKRIDARTVKSTVKEIAENQSRNQASKCLTMLRAMLTYAEGHGQIDTNPAQGIQPSQLGATKSAPRDRVLSLSEIKRLWDAIESARLDTSAAAALKLLILTGQRRGELLQAKWDHIDLEEGRWTLPAITTKSRRGHTVYLSDAAVELLREQQAVTGKLEYVFESQRAIGQPIGDASLTTAIARLQGRKLAKQNMKAPLADMPRFSVHDLRRSMATGLLEHCGTAPHVVEQMLNHKPTDRLIETYQRHDYAKEQRIAWQSWGQLITNAEVAEQTNVVPMRRVE